MSLIAEFTIGDIVRSGFVHGYLINKTKFWNRNRVMNIDKLREQLKIDEGCVYEL